MKTRDFTSDAEVQELLEAFEAGTIAPSQFNHAAHIATALGYLAILPLPEATARMRSSLLQFTAHHGTNVYHETLTSFWMRLLHHLAEGPYRDIPLWSRINLIVKRWGNAGAVEAHYSRALITSKIAREQWMPPDRLPLKF
ncbi:MAG: hypothetical protein M3O66_02390 [Verrucomicrobiota bacterium]|nr:hypothetical protein [Verrucomicrobiota bacterium]